LCAGGFLACASTSAPPAPAAAVDPAPTTAQVGPDTDPFQGFNRAMFWVNDRVLDRFIYGPLARGWIYITPLTVRTHMEQFFDNLNFPGYFVQPLLQGDPVQSGVALTRFTINSSIGVAGIFDPADHFWGLKRRPEDMGQTFGVWGIPPGPFLVLPLIAPTTTVRDFAGWPVDQVLNVGDTYFWSWFAPYGETMMRDVNRRALADDALTAGREAAYDWYSAARDAYLQRREAEVRNGADAPQEGPNDDLYQIDESEPEPQ
jgi:phospholipid-binding lipoprotein MlaA